MSSSGEMQFSLFQAYSLVENFMHGLILEAPAMATVRHKQNLSNPGHCISSSEDLLKVASLIRIINQTCKFLMLSCLYCFNRTAVAMETYSVRL